MTMIGGQFMFRKSSDEDITEEEYEKYIGPHRELTEKFLEEFIKNINKNIHPSILYLFLEWQMAE